MTSRVTLRSACQALSIAVGLVAAGFLAHAETPVVTFADPLSTVRGAPQDGPLYAYEMRYEAGEISAAGTIDPTQPEGARVTVTNPAEADWPEGFAETIAELDSEADGDIWCASLLEMVPETAGIATETRQIATYTFSPIANDDTDGPRRKLFRALIGSVTLDKVDPAVLSFQLHLPEPMKPHFLVKIERFSLFAECARAPDGRTYVARFETDLAGSAMGNRFDESERREIVRLIDPQNG